MRYALLSDIHGNLPALEAVLAEIRQEKVDGYLLLGDYLVGPWAEEVATLLRGLPGVAVSGNEDAGLVGHAKALGWQVDGMGRRPAADALPKGLVAGQFGAGPWLAATVGEETLQWLAQLPETVRVQGPEGMTPVWAGHDPKVPFADTTVATIAPLWYARAAEEGRFSQSGFAAYVDGLLREDDLLAEKLAGREEVAFCFGHMHVQWAGRVNGKLLVGPGSVGLPLDFDRRAAWALLEYKDGGWCAKLRRTAYDVEGALKRYRASAYAQAVPVWAWVIGKEIETAREVAYPFVDHAQALANRQGVGEYPLPPEVWQPAYHAYKKARPHGEGPAVWIEKARREDLAEILALQKVAYQSEAALLGDTAIPPMRQTLEEVEAEHGAGVILKAVDYTGRIVGSVRGRAEEGTLHVGKLMVLPEMQGRGLGGLLLEAVERALPQPRCELFTSTLSKGNIRLYEHRGYRVFGEKQAGPRLRLVYLQKLQPGR